MASPFPAENPKDADVLVKPAVNGVKAVFAASHRAMIKRLVFTSSTVSVVGKYTMNLFSDPLIFPLNPHDASKHYFASPKNDLITYTLGVYNKNFHGTVLK